MSIINDKEIAKYIAKQVANDDYADEEQFILDVLRQHKEDTTKLVIQDMK